MQWSREAGSFRPDPIRGPRSGPYRDCSDTFRKGRRKCERRRRERSRGVGQLGPQTEFQHKSRGRGGRVANIIGAPTNPHCTVPPPLSPQRASQSGCAGAALYSLAPGPVDSELEIFLGR